jgi:hypothetical protein
LAKSGSDAAVAGIEPELGRFAHGVRGIHTY